MQRIEPAAVMKDLPAIESAIRCALSAHLQEGPPLNRGWASLEMADEWIRANLAVKCCVEYEAGFRPKFGDLPVQGMAIVCVYGWYVFVQDGFYWAFEDLTEKPVVKIWYLSEGVRIV